MTENTSQSQTSPLCSSQGSVAPGENVGVVSNQVADKVLGTSMTEATMSQIHLQENQDSIHIHAQETNREMILNADSVHTQQAKEIREPVQMNQLPQQTLGIGYEREPFKTNPMAILDQEEPFLDFSKKPGYRLTKGRRLPSAPSTGTGTGSRKRSLKKERANSLGSRLALSFPSVSKDFPVSLIKEESEAETRPELLSNPHIGNLNSSGVLMEEGSIPRVTVSTFFNKLPSLAQLSLSMAPHTMTAPVESQTLPVSYPTNVTVTHTIESQDIAVPESMIVERESSVKPSTAKSKCGVSRQVSISQAEDENVNSQDERDTKSNRQKGYVQKACSHCKSSHVACDDNRPCQRCIRLGRADSCEDAERKRRGRPRRKGLPSVNMLTTSTQDDSSESFASIPTSQPHSNGVTNAQCEPCELSPSISLPPMQYSSVPESLTTVSSITHNPLMDYRSRVPTQESFLFVSPLPSATISPVIPKKEMDLYHKIVLDDAVRQVESNRRFDTESGTSSMISSPIGSPPLRPISTKHLHDSNPSIEPFSRKRSNSELVSNSQAHRLLYSHHERHGVPYTYHHHHQYRGGLRPSNSYQSFEKFQSIREYDEDSRVAATILQSLPFSQTDDRTHDTFYSNTNQTEPDRSRKDNVLHTHQDQYPQSTHSHKMNIDPPPAQSPEIQNLPEDVLAAVSALSMLLPSDNRRC